MIQLNEQQKQFLISKGPYQSALEKFPCNKAISKSKQKSFPYFEYSPMLDQACWFACNLFGDGPGSACTETSWDKMKSQGKNKKGKLLEHFGSVAHRLAAERLANFKQKATACKRRTRMAVKQKNNKCGVRLLLTAKTTDFDMPWNY